MKQAAAMATSTPISLLLFKAPAPLISSSSSRASLHSPSKFSPDPKRKFLRLSALGDAPSEIPRVPPENTPEIPPEMPRPPPMECACRRRSSGDDTRVQPHSGGTVRARTSPASRPCRLHLSRRFHCRRRMCCRGNLGQMWCLRFRRRFFLLSRRMLVHRLLCNSVLVLEFSPPLLLHRRLAFSFWNFLLRYAFLVAEVKEIIHYPSPTKPNRYRNLQRCRLFVRFTYPSKPKR
ncbi:uncharacterized protein A4U43_UnF9150 [Asparagus officinalis]|uniref:Uncharacterized protein n=1 Tax=Asparagus officinalis TaxID=4686 RepID=A0A1R3L5R2_ASPOF|nr:uncharacterized protein A4U43_UnF9150 [Asparagus officinalis]